MTRFLSTRLDLSRLRSITPALIIDLNYEAIVAARLASLRVRLPDADAIGNAYNPLTALQEEDGYRQLLDYGHLNDRYRGLLWAFATGTDLDQVVARAGVVRLPGEDDDTLRMRYITAFGAPAAGSEDAYVFAALTAWPQAWDVRCVGPEEHGEPGKVDVVVTAAAGAAVPSGALIAIERAINGKSVRPLTDEASAIAAIVTPYAVSMTAQILPGPDPAAIRSEIIVRLQEITAGRYRSGGEVPREAIAAAAYEAGAVSVTVAHPAAPIARDPYRAPYCTGIGVTVTERLFD